jgi:hypothetical protein
VENFGAYWDKGFIDTALEGSWKKIGIPGEKLSDTPGADQLLFTKNGDCVRDAGHQPCHRRLPPDVPRHNAEKDNDGRSHAALAQHRPARVLHAALR